MGSKGKTLKEPGTSLRPAILPAQFLEAAAVDNVRPRGVWLGR